MIGTQIGDLRLVRLLGRGGMGSVYLAEHRLLNDLRAVKILDPTLAHHGEVVTRFLNEGRAAVKLKHPNLVLVHDIGRLPDNGPYYMVMEYLDGMSLAGFLAEQAGPVSIHRTLEILASVLDCAQYMHEHRVIHRDLKPDNLFLVPRPKDPCFVKVLDLGIALVSDAIAEGPDTRAGVILGTPVYMAPEQFVGSKVTARADVFAIGLIAYEMLTGGWFPWQEDHEPRDVYRHLREGVLYHRQRIAPPADPRRRCPGISEGVARVLLRTLDEDPDRRPESARDLALLLAEQAPSDETHESGFQILEKRAKPLLQGLSSAGSGTRAPRPSPRASGKLRYQLGSKLGAGGMAEVFEGTLVGAEGFERRVAIKRVLSGLSEVPGFVEMFVSEARIASRLNHTNVVSVFDFDRDDDGRLYLVMEYVHGKDLATLLEAGPIPPSLIIYIVVEMLRGVGYAHAPEPGRDGLVHRDMSPQNLLLSYEGAVKVVDFGLAKVRSASGNARSEHVRGKPSYMSPEQCNGEALDARSDLFAVGVMLHEMLTHQPLFTGTVKEILARVLFQKIPAPSSMRSRVPADLERITMKLLSRTADERYPTAEAVIEDLLQCEDAPRDGRGELVHVLAQRFPDAALRTRFGASGTGRGSKPVSGRPLVAEQMAVPVAPQVTVTDPGPVSTLAGAASQSVPVVAARSRPWMGALGLGAGTAVLLSLLAVLVVFARFGSRTSAVQPTAPAAVTLGDTGRDTPTVPEAARHEPAATSSAVVPAPNVPAQPRHEAAVAAPGAMPVAAPPGPTAAQQLSVPTPASPSPTAATAPSSAPDTGSSRSPGPAAVSTKELGQLAILVRPWAAITLNGKASGATPYRQNVPAGRYRIRLSNEDIGQSEVLNVTVEPNQTTTVERKW